MARRLQYVLMRKRIAWTNVTIRLASTTDENGSQNQDKE